jgi:hypothetical protein
MVHPHLIIRKTSGIEAFFPERKRKMKCLQSTGPKFWLWRGKLSLCTNKDNGRVETIKSDETGMGRQTSKEKKNNSHGQS